MKGFVRLIFGVGIAIIVVGGVLGIISDIALLTSGPFSEHSLALVFGQVASPVWEGLALVALSKIIERMSRNS